jgi:hypothetical protein
MDDFDGQFLWAVQQRVMDKTTVGVFAWLASRTFTNRMFATKTIKTESSSHAEMYLLSNGKRLEVLAVC